MSGIEQKIPFGASLNQRAVSKVLDHIQNLSGKAPVSLVKATDKTNTVWMVKFETDGTYTLPMIKLPIHTSEYSRVPYQAGAKGFVGSADIDLGAMTGLGASGPASFTRPANLAALVFHPLGNTNFKAALDPNAHETYGAAGGTITHDGTGKSLVKTHKDDGTSVSSGGDGTGAPGPHAMTTHPDNGTSIMSTVAHVLGAPNASLDKDGNQSNQGNSTTKQNISSTSGNISAAAGMVSGLVGSFASGGIGGVSFGGGGGGGSGTLSMGALTATTGPVSGPVVQTTEAYTVAGLNVAMPPTTALAGTRAFVTDAASSTFFAVLAGGGTLVVPAFCTGTQWVAA